MLTSELTVRFLLHFCRGKQKFRKKYLDSEFRISPYGVLGILTTVHPWAQGILTRAIDGPIVFLPSSCNGLCQGHGCGVGSYHWSGKPGHLVNPIIAGLFD